MKRLTLGFTLVLLAVLLAIVSFKGKKPRPLPATEAELGKLLFFDSILSGNHKLSCASCHNPQFAFADTVSFSRGIQNNKISRNTPSVMNVASRESFFWDGRAGTLEEQALIPVANPLEMSLALDEMEKRLLKNSFYRQAFTKIYGKLPDKMLTGKALAAFERTLETASTPFDLYVQGDSTAISKSAINGREIFLEKGKCFECHFGPDFTGDEFKNIGLYNGLDLKDSGRGKITGKFEDLGKFKVPGLRNVSLTAPYMHNGMFATLEAVVEYYNNPDKLIANSVNRDTLLAKPLNLSESEKRDLVNFLKTLTP